VVSNLQIWLTNGWGSFLYSLRNEMINCLKTGLWYMNTEMSNSFCVHPYRTPFMWWNLAARNESGCHKNKMFWEELITYFLLSLCIKYLIRHRPHRKKLRPTVQLLHVSVAARTCLLRCCLATAVSSGSTILAFRCKGENRQQGDLIRLLLFF
jgi:hypothetical protein